MHLRTAIALIVAALFVTSLAGIGAAEGLGKYKDLDRAEADGYVATPCVPEMGVHYINFALVDEEVKVSEPEALVYANTEDGLELIGVEYLATESFTLFDHESESTPLPGIEGLHAWFFTNAPNGMHAHHPGNVDADCNLLD